MDHSIQQQADQHVKAVGWFDPVVYAQDLHQHGVMIGSTFVFQGLTRADLAASLAHHLNAVLIDAQEDLDLFRQSPGQMRRSRQLMIWVAGLISYAVGLFGLCCLITWCEPNPFQDAPWYLAPIGYFLRLGFFVAIVPAILFHGSLESSNTFSLVAVRRKIYRQALTASTFFISVEIGLLFLLRMLLWAMT